MGDKTKIEWAEASWNPIRATGRVALNGLPHGFHCEIITPGCEHCYAQEINKRLGTHRPYLRRERSNVSIYLDEKTLSQPLRWRKPRKVFVCSMSDLFGEWVPDEMIDRIFAIMALCPQHTFQILTKRAERMRDYASEFAAPGRIGRHLHALSAAAKGDAFTLWQAQDRLIEWPLPNVWKGCSVEDQRRADERIPLLLDTPAAVRWVSLEPLLSAVDISPWVGLAAGPHWYVVGGESGPGARPFKIEWARSIIAQCKAAGVACFMKQVGAHPYYGVPSCGPKLRDRKGGAMEEWPVDIRVREYPAQQGVRA